MFVQDQEKVPSDLMASNDDSAKEKDDTSSSFTSMNNEDDTTSHSTKSNMSKLESTRTVPLVELELDNITYAPFASTASSEKTRITVLSHVSTKIEPYKLSAWLAPSGGGKTSLMSVAANLVQPGDLLEPSVIKVNGQEGKIPKRLVGVVWQDDLLLSNLTVQETIYFSARLKSPAHLSNAEIHQVVEETMAELGLLRIRHSLIGSASGAGARGISGGERKRVSVASELVIRPPLLLLDEPTSGLDSTSAQALMTSLKELANMGHAVAVVIHQPRTAIFNLFDNLLLLSNGRTVYNGKACQVRAYLELLGETLPPETGIADWLMDTISEDECRADGGVLPKFWQEYCERMKDTLSSEHDDNVSENEQPNSNNSHTLTRRMSSLQELKAIRKFEASFWTQLKLLTSRTLKQNRGERLTRVSILLCLTYVFFTALFWWQIPNDTGHVFDRNSLLFFILIAQANGVVISSITVFQRERALLNRERAKKLYRVLPYFLAKTLSDMTNNVLLPCVYAAVIYWVANLRPTASAFFKFLLAIYSTISTAQSMGLFLSIAIPSTQIALILAPPITLLFMILGGFYIPFENMHPGIQWASWLSFARYGYSSLLVNEFWGRGIPCSEDGVAISIGDSGLCPQPGADVVTSLGITGISTNYWFNVGIVVALQLFFRVGAYVLLRRSSK